MRQQLLLVILATIIVGISTIVAIHFFGSTAENANRDAIREDLSTAATHSQRLWARPEMMGGAGSDFSNLTAAQIAERIGIPGDIADAIITNEHAVYTVENPATNTLQITATPNGSEGNWSITILRQENGSWLTTINDHNGEDQILGIEE